MKNPVAQNFKKDKILSHFEKSQHMNTILQTYLEDKREKEEASREEGLEMAKSQCKSTHNYDCQTSLQGIDPFRKGYKKGVHNSNDSYFPRDSRHVVIGYGGKCSVPDAEVKKVKE